MLRSTKYLIFDRADSIDLTAHSIARLEEARWIQSNTHAFGRAGGDEIAGLEGESGGQIGDLGPDAVNQLPSVAVLARLSVDEASDTESMRVGYLVGCDDPRSDRTVSIEGFAHCEGR
jgi:hypothetical protein